MAMKFWAGFFLCLLLVDLNGAASIDVEKGTDYFPFVCLGLFQCNVSVLFHWNKKAFQLKVKRPLVDTTSVIVNKFEYFQGSL